MAILNFDATKVAPDEGRTGPVPVGWYVVMLTSSEIKPTSTGRGNFLFCTFTIMDGELNGRKLFHRFNTQHDNETTVKIGLGQLSALCHAINVMCPRDSVEMHNIPLKVRVRIRPAEDGHEPSNEITAFKHISEVVTEAAPPPPAPPKGRQPPAWQQPGSQQVQQLQQPAPAGWQQPVQQSTPAWQPPQTAQPWQQPQQAQQPQSQPQPWQQPQPIQQPWQQPQPVTNGSGPAPVSGAAAPSAANPTQEPLSQPQPLTVGTMTVGTTTSLSNSSPPWAR